MPACRIKGEECAQPRIRSRSLLIDPRSGARTRGFYYGAESRSGNRESLSSRRKPWLVSAEKATRLGSRNLESAVVA